MGGGAWPFLVGGVICLVNSVNERDLNLLNRYGNLLVAGHLLRGTPRGLGNLVKAHRDGDRLLQLLVFNEEFLVSASHQLVLITSLPFVHTARRSYRLSDPVNNSDC
eukprot:gene287-gene134